MKRSQILVLVPLLCWAVLTVPVATGAESVLGVIPDGALGLAVINRLSETDSKLQKLNDELQLPLPGLTTFLKSRVGVEQGFDASGTVAVALMMDPTVGPFPVAVMFVPVTDYEKFMEDVRTDDAEDGISPMRLAGAAAFAGQKGNYAVITKSNHRELLKRVLSSPSQVPPSLKPWQQWLADSDAAVVVTRPGVQALCLAAQAGLQQVTQRIEQSSTQDVPDIETTVAVLRLYQSIPEFAAKEVMVYGAAIELGADSSLRLTERVRLTPEGEAVAMIRDAKAPQAGLLAGLPAKPMVGVLSGVTTERISKAMMSMSIGVMKAAPGIYGLDDEQIAEMADITAGSMQGVRGMSMMMCEGEPNDPLFGNIVGLATVDDAKAYLDRYKEMLAAMNELTKGVESSVLMRMEFEDVELGGCEGLKVTTQIPGNPLVQNVPDYEKSMKMMFGAEKQISFYLAVADQHTLLLSYVSPELLLESLEVVRGAKPGLANDASIAETVATLPTDAPWGAHISPRGVVNFVKQAVTLSGEGVATLDIPEFPACPPVGVAVTVEPNGMKSETVVPAATMKAIGQYVVQGFARRAAANVEDE